MPVYRVPTQLLSETVRFSFISKDLSIIITVVKLIIFYCDKDQIQDIMPNA